jgi:hypothetical protein
MKFIFLFVLSTLAIAQPAEQLANYSCEFFRPNKTSPWQFYRSSAFDYFVQLGFNQSHPIHLSMRGRQKKWYSAICADMSNRGGVQALNIHLVMGLELEWNEGSQCLFSGKEISVMSVSQPIDPDHRFTWAIQRDQSIGEFLFIAGVKNDLGLDPDFCANTLGKVFPMDIRADSFYQVDPNQVDIFIKDFGRL